MQNKRSTEDCESILSSIDESSTEYDYDDVSISTNDLKDISYGNQIHPELNAIDYIFRICDRIKQTQNEWNGEELSAKITGKALYKVFKAVVNELNNASLSLGKSGSEVLQFIPEPSKFAEVTRLPADVKKVWLKETLKEKENLINIHNFLMNYPEKLRSSDTMHGCIQGKDSI